MYQIEVMSRVFRLIKEQELTEPTVYLELRAQGFQLLIALLGQLEASGVTKTVLEMITDLSIEAVAKATTKDEIYAVFQKYGVAFKEGR